MRACDIGALTAVLIAIAQGQLRISTLRDAYDAVVALDKRRRPNAPLDAVDVVEWLKEVEEAK